MQCPKCQEDMEFEEAKNFHGYWYCECGYESPGSMLPCGVEGGCVDYEERMEDNEYKPGNKNYYSDLQELQDEEKRYEEKLGIKE